LTAVNASVNIYIYIYIYIYAYIQINKTQTQPNKNSSHNYLLRATSKPEYWNRIPPTPRGTRDTDATPKSDV